MTEAECTRCPLSQSRTTVVVGRGCPTARVMFLGEAPGRAEDQTGLGFQGAAGQRFDEILRFIGLTRSDIWLANAVRCRPSVDGRRNRPPRAEEILACRHWLLTDLTRIRPRLVVTLGRVAFESVTETAWSAEKRATPLPVPPKNLVVFALYHPAYLIYRRDLFFTYRTDLYRLRSVLEDVGIALPAPQGPWAV